MDVIDRVRQPCARLPEVTEGVSVHHPSFQVRGKSFVMTADADGDALWIKSVRPAQEELVAAEPARFFVPPYLGHHGWVGLRVDGATDWDEAAELIVDAYRLAAPRRLAAQVGVQTE